ncbi:ABC transporter permease [Alloacidobacterium sp.]|uniref:ABC transporter permease n=1 Tax=Alloacidobacterium sp. TaxID=2951999 RepID=UPI002D50F54A|nr:ABC transporter permease [Alloacidobacterium sp.]HYK37340.1 ABC transporter permease [Alloacidobacterium sp.]
MRWLRKLTMRWKMLFRRNKEGALLDDELQFHMEQQIAENIAAGMSIEEARHAAMRAFGNPTALRDQTRNTWSWNWLESLWRDMRIAARTLCRTPGFAVIAILVMALGIGANVALFTIVRSVLLKPLPFKDPDQLVRLYEHSSDDKFPYNSSSGGMFEQWKKQNKSFSDLAIWGYAGYNLSSTGEQLPENVRAGSFSWNLLPTLGVQPALGRNFTAADDQPSANATVILSWGLWKRRFGGSPSVLGQTILLDARPYTVVGVMPSWFALPHQAAQLWTPIYYREEPATMQALDDHQFIVIGRLKPGVTEAHGVSELSLITRRIHDQHRDNPFISKGANIRPLLDWIIGDVKRPLYVLLAATGCVLLIACLNVANLLVSRSAARRKELAVRTAIGGSRLRLLREHLMESFLLSAAGGLLGCLLAYGVLQWLISTRQVMIRTETIHMDAVVAVVSLGLVVLCAMFAGLISAASIKSDQVLSALQDSSRSHSTGHARATLRKVLLSLEVGLTVVLLIGTGLLLRSYAKLRSSDLGCITQNVLTMNFNLPEAQYTQLTQRISFFETLLMRVRNLPGVRAAGLIFSVVPGDGYGGDRGFVIPEHPPLPQGKYQYAMNRWVNPGYFAAIGIPILHGRTFNDDQRPGHATETIISRSFAEQYFPGEYPIGKHLITEGGHKFEIVGVVGDTLFEIGEPVQPMMYFGLYTPDWLNGASLVVRSDQDVTRFALPIQRIVGQLDRDLPASDILTMDQVIGRNTIDASFDAMLLLVFATLSLVLAAVGLFGVLSYIVAQRTTEIGIRMALGAQREQVMRSMLGDGLRPAILGLSVGLLASAGVTRLIESMLYGTSPFDPLVFVLAAATLLFVSVLACVLPAWRASRLDPMQALRTE